MCRMSRCVHLLSTAHAVRAGTSPLLSPNSQMPRGVFTDNQLIDQLRNNCPQFYLIQVKLRTMSVTQKCHLEAIHKTKERFNSLSAGKYHIQPPHPHPTHTTRPLHPETGRQPTHRSTGGGFPPQQAHTYVHPEIPTGMLFQPYGTPPPYTHIHELRIPSSKGAHIRTPGSTNRHTRPVKAFMTHTPRTDHNTTLWGDGEGGRTRKRVKRWCRSPIEAQLQALLNSDS